MGLLPFEKKVNGNKPFKQYCAECVQGLIPYAAKWKLTNHSTYLFRGGWGLIPYEDNEEKWTLINKPYLFRGGGGIVPF